IDGNQSGSVVTFENGEDSTALLSGFTIQNGLGFRGGGVYYSSTANARLDNLTIINNTSNSGGGIALMGSSPVIANVTIAGNSAVSGSGLGGGIYCNGQGPILKQALITNNLASYGGGVYCNNSNITFTKVSIIGNYGESGSGIFLKSHSNSTNANIINTIITDNPDGFESTSYQITLSQQDDGSNYLDIEYSNIQDGEASIDINNSGTLTWGSGNLDVDPMFVDSANGNYNLVASSMLINAGHPDSSDSDGSRADIGAYPYLNSYSGPTWYITESGNDTTATGASDDPFRSIQAALNFGSDDDTAFVSAGTYNENLVYRYDESASIRSVSIIGEDKATTIIDGQNSGNCIRLSHNGYSTVTIKDFTVRNGYSERSENNQGGGIMVGFKYD
ncbi:uncharacterized protein METZ01_LOCUS295624, partial [marine metagenome]